MIYFVHIPKTAGTSMRRLFVEGRREESVALVYLPPAGLALDDVLALPRTRIDRLELVYGHFRYGIHQLLARPGTYITCLRATRPRLISNFRQHVRGGFVGDTPMLEYFNAWQPKDMDNYAVRLLAGLGQDLPFGGVTAAHLRQARENLLTRFAAFGIYEFFEETVARFRAVLGGSAAPVGHENVIPAAEAPLDLPEAEVAALLAHNALDEQLYAFARQRFVSQR